MKKNFLFILLFFLTSHVLTAYGQQLEYVGIPSESMDYYAAGQNNSQWCWAASIQMVLNSYGVNITQEQIVARTYGANPWGVLPNWPGSFQVIHRNLNNWGVDNSGNHYVVSASIGLGAPTPKILIDELSKGKPVIIGYKSGPNSGHAVVVTAVSYINSWNGPIIQTIVVRDPWPSALNKTNKGRIEYPGIALAQNIQAYWYIRVNK